MRTMPFKMRSHIRRLQRRSGPHAGLRLHSRHVKNFRPLMAQQLLFVIGRDLRSTRQFLWAYRVPRWDGPKQTNRLEIAFCTVLLGKVAKSLLMDH
jgi:hypothetical protein